jgi:hypothetical protein
LTQQQYDNEDYTLQIDSHMRFAPNWDEILINMLKTLKAKGIKKPMLTSYVPSYDPENDPAGRVQEPWQMVYDRFTPEGVVLFLPEIIPSWRILNEPVRARFYSGHFCFTIGEFARDVQHDPEFYFHGEEISITVRAFTHGYDLFHPHRVVIWHEYTRKGRVKQWDDDKDWTKRNKACHLKNRQLLGIDGELYAGDIKKYFGTQRTIRDYEMFAGILFSKRGVQKYTLDKKYPPNPEVDNWETSFMRPFKYCISLPISKVPENDYEFWAVIFKNKGEDTLHREDCNQDEILRVKAAQQETVKIWREFSISQHESSGPEYWVVWPFSKSKGWCEQIDGTIL